MLPIYVLRHDHSTNEETAYCELWWKHFHVIIFFCFSVSHWQYFAVIFSGWSWKDEPPRPKRSSQPSCEKQIWGNCLCGRNSGIFHSMNCTIVSIAFFVATFTAQSQQWSNDEISILLDLIDSKTPVIYSRMTRKVNVFEYCCCTVSCLLVFGCVRERVGE